MHCHVRQAEPLGDPALDLAEHGSGLRAPTDVLSRRHLHDAHETELDVHVDDGAMGGEGERRVAVALAVLVELLGRPVVVLDRPVERRIADRLGRH